MLMLWLVLFVLFVLFAGDGVDITADIADADVAAVDVDAINSKTALLTPFLVTACGMLVDHYRTYYMYL